MSFDKDTRNLLAKTVTACRRRLTEDVTDQLRGVFGLHPDGTMLALDKLTHLSPDQTATAHRLRDLLDHYTAVAAGKEPDRRKASNERMVLEISFTMLNRLAALRLCEERGLVVECVRQGTASDGFRLFERISSGALGGRYETYKVFMECLFDEFALDLGVLFDRMTPQSAVFPSERCMEDVLSELNKADLSHLWIEDETIGWIYQYFNPPEERKAMRDASQAPRNSRELAVRNQFFTPRYVVEFLTDNTLGRIWYEMRMGDTALKEECRYLVRRLNEVFLAPGEKAPAEPENETDLSQEELLKKTVHIEHRPKKDPRDLSVLDPACGSGHFLLYAFDLLERIYEEAWEDPESPKSESAGRTLREDFETLDDLHQAVPKLIIEHNLYGIDIDPRAVQIAALALWLRAQKTWGNLGIKAVERQQVVKSNIVTAEPVPGEEDIRREFSTNLKPRVLGQLMNVVFDKMRLAGEAGSLLKIEEEIKDAIAEARKQWLEGPKPEQQLLFPGISDPRPKQQELHFDLKGVTDKRFWEQAENRILKALEDYAERAENGHAIRRRLFAKDAAHGFAFIDLCRKRYDVVVMNPPFGEPSSLSTAYIASKYGDAKHDLAASFLERSNSLCRRSSLSGAITTRALFFLPKIGAWRQSFSDTRAALIVFADLGFGVLDSAMVETAAYVFSKSETINLSTFIRLLREDDKEAKLLSSSTDDSYSRTYICDSRKFSLIPKCPFIYWVSDRFRDTYKNNPNIKSTGASVKQGLATAKDFRFVRALWEVPVKDVVSTYTSSTDSTLDVTDRVRDSLISGKKWVIFAKGGGYSPYFLPVHLVVNWASNGAEIKARVNPKSGKPYSNVWQLAGTETNFFFRAGITWPRRAYGRLSFRVMPKGCIFGDSAPTLFVDDENLLLTLLVIGNSRLFEKLLSVWSARGTEATSGQTMKMEVGSLLDTPLPNGHIPEHYRDIVKRMFHLVQIARSTDETSPIFLASVKSDEFQKESAEVDEFLIETENIACDIYGLSGLDCDVHSDAYDEFVSNKGDRPTDDWSPDIDSAEEVEVKSDSKDRVGSVKKLFSLAVGFTLGRWDIRIALDQSLVPKLPDPFDPLPVCPPGMLVGSDGMPADRDRIVSEEWLRARPDANTLPAESTVKNPNVPDNDYPLRVSWDGILVDDPGFNSAQPHRDDIIRRVREVLDLLWKDKAYENEQEACDILGVSGLRDYFHKPGGFFQDHLKRYTKSQRKAPIYWPLSTASGSYTIWLYYHRLTDQTIYGAVNKYVEPKIAETERGIARIKDELEVASGRDAARMRDRLNETQAFLGELRDFREELLRIAALPYRPNLNDGGIINAAPLHNLFRLRSWANDTKSVWDKLENGDYDWAQLAYTIWPDQVRKTCKKDRSIAIAHGLEDLCEIKASVPKKKGKRRTKT